MHDGIRRLSLLLIITCAAAILTFQLRGRGPSYGLFHLLRGEQAPAAASPGPTTTFARESALSPHEVPNLASLSEEQTKLAEAILPSVVSISTSRRVWLPKALPHEEQAVMAQPGLGSGVIVSEEGLVLTAYHVVAGVDEIQLFLHDGKPLRARLRGHDRVDDVALLEIEAAGRRFQPLRLASSQVRQGELVFAVGCPFGQQGTLTQGIITNAQPRRLSDDAPAWLQTNTVINPGSSGGPLVNVRGDVVGLNVAIYRAQKDIYVWQGVGLAIPVSDVREAMNAILKRGDAGRGFLGIYANDLDSFSAAELGLAEPAGAFIKDTVSNSPAALAGLRSFDVIVSYNGQPVANADDLVRKIHRAVVGETVRLGFYRERQLMEANATVGATTTATPNAELAERAWDLVGLKLRDMSSEEKLRSQFNPLTSALRVMDVREGSPAGQVLRQGDIILEMNGQIATTTPAFLNALLKANGQKLSLKVASQEGKQAVVEIAVP